MTRLRLVLSSILIFALVSVIAANAGRGTAAETSGTVPARSFEFTCVATAPISIPSSSA